MRKLTRLAVMLSLLALPLLSPVWAHSQASGQVGSPTKVKSHPSYRLFFMLHAEKGIISKTNNGYELTLQDLSDKVLYVSDRPVRKAGFIVLSHFMKRWELSGSSFNKTPPNAVMVHSALKTDENGVAHAVAVELSNPVKLDKGAWTFKIRVLNGPLSVGSYTGVEVFVDDWNIDPHYFR